MIFNIHCYLDASNKTHETQLVFYTKVSSKIIMGIIILRYQECVKGS